MRRRFGLLLFLLIYGSIIALAHSYFVLRLVLVPQVPSPFAEIAILAIVTLGLCLFLRPLADRFASERFTRALSWPALVWMGVGFLLLMLLIASDVVLSLAGGVAWAMGEPSPAAALSERTEALTIVIVALGLSAWALHLALRPPTLRRLEVPIAGWPAKLDRFRIVQLSDMHIGPILDRRFAETIVAQVNALRADLVAITGDLVDGSVERIAAEVEPLRRLESRHGTFFVTGNHDYFSRVDPWVEKARELGMRVLRNERTAIGEDDATFDLAGVDDRMAGQFGHGQGEDLDAALAGRDRSRPVVLLAHNPNGFPKAAAEGVDLQLSGHTHGGQIWPFHLFVRMSTPFVAGEYVSGRSRLYVSRGTGFWGPPMRLFWPAEITEITLRAAP